MRAVLLALVAVGPVGNSAVRAAETSAELIVGEWEVAYSDTPDTVPVGTKLEFAGGKLKLTVKGPDGKERTELVGSYAIDKEYLVVTGSGAKPDKGRICLLNKTSLVLNDDVKDKVMVLKRVKKN